MNKPLTAEEQKVVETNDVSKAFSKTEPKKRNWLKLAGYAVIAVVATSAAAYLGYTHFNEQSSS